MTDPTDPVCQWCGQPVPAVRATWWDDRPQCPDPFACDKRITATGNANTNTT